MPKSVRSARGYRIAPVLMLRTGSGVNVNVLVAYACSALRRFVPWVVPCGPRSTLWLRRWGGRRLVHCEDGFGVLYIVVLVASDGLGI